MPYVLNEGNGTQAAVFSVCADLSYAQAEVLYIAEKLKKENSFYQIIGEFNPDKAFAVDRLLHAYAKEPASLKRIEELRTEIKEKGFSSFVVREYPGDFHALLRKNPRIETGRCVEDLANMLTCENAIARNQELREAVEDLYANPLHAGVHVDFPATISEEAWVSDALRSMKRASQQHWLRRMLSVMRSYFKGTPLAQLPNKLDRCPCGSSKKYGKCCGYEVEDQDPENCKLGLHDYGPWQNLAGKYITTCFKCYRLKEAPWSKEIKINKMVVMIVGCSVCQERPTDKEVDSAISYAETWNICGICNKGFSIERLLLEHSDSTGKHSQKWMASQIVYKEKSVDLESRMLEKRLFVHLDCFTKALPLWPGVARKVPNQNREISIDIPDKETV